MTRAGLCLSALALCVCPALAGAQAADGALEVPRSAIDWLNEVTPEEALGEDALSLETPITQSAATPAVEAKPLAGDDGAGLGLLGAAASGLPPTLWQGATAEALTRALAALPDEALQPVASLRNRLLLAAAAAPFGFSENGFAVYRAQRLVQLGFVSEAGALLETLDPMTEEGFAVFFDLALVNSSEDRACAMLRADASLMQGLEARIFCLARTGDWNAAALSLQTATLLGDIPPGMSELLAQFLEPELADAGAPDLGDAPVTPLALRLREAIGEPLSTQGLPRLFAHNDLRAEMGWKAQLEAAERLARTGAVSPNLLLGLYTQRRPAASGGVWDRASAIQALDEALTAGDARELGEALPQAWEAMAPLGLAPVLAAIAAPALDGEMKLPGRAAEIRDKLLFLSDRFEMTGAQAPAFWRAVSFGDVSDISVSGALEAAIARGFGADEPAPATDNAAAPLGLRILKALGEIEAAAQGDLSSLAPALASLRAMGLESTARQAALHLLIAP
ncbi:MAG: hypothetical protein AAF841_09985 [Pseudomonadota bacterium]